MPRIPDETLNEILRRADMVAVVGRYTQLRKNGASFVGLCPFHNEKTPSFRVNPERGAFKCFGCGEGGGLFQFLMKIESLPFPEVVRRLGHEVGVEIVVEETDDAETTRRKRLLELLERCSHYYHELLVKSPVGREALEYLYSRGLDMPTIERFRLGWAPNGGTALLQKLSASGYRPEEGDEVGVLRERGGRYSDMLRARVVFPIFDIQDRVVAFGGRVLDQSQPKYLNSPETFLYSKRRNLYGLQLHRGEISKQDRALIVEGYLDVVSVSKVGVGIAVASLGTALTAEQSALLRRYTRNVTMAYDADRAGQNATVKGIELFEQAGLRVNIASMPNGEDPDSIARRQGKAGLEEMLNSAQSVIDYLISVNEGRFDLSRPEGKEDFAREVLPALDKIQDPVRQQAYVVRVARVLGISENRLQWRVSSKQQGALLQRHRGQIDSRSPEARLFRVCIAHPEWFEQVRTKMAPDLITSDRFRPLFAALWQVRVSDQPIQLQDLSPYLEDPEASADLTELLLEPPPTSTAEDVEKLVQSLRDKYDEFRLESLKPIVVQGLENGTMPPDDERYVEYKQLQRRLKGAR
ncbi:MAG: DNA primase [Vulcanimicrobiota bacterium]